MLLTVWLLHCRAPTQSFRFTPDTKWCILSDFTSFDKKHFGKWFLVCPPVEVLRVSWEVNTILKTNFTRKISLRPIFARSLLQNYRANSFDSIALHITSLMTLHLNPNRGFLITTSRLSENWVQSRPQFGKTEEKNQYYTCTYVDCMYLLLIRQG